MMARRPAEASRSRRTMHSVTSLFIWLLLLCAVVASSPSNERYTSNEEQQFQLFIKTFGRTYQPGSAEYDAKMQCFTRNMARYAIMNANSTTRSHGHTATFGINKFADRCSPPLGIHPSADLWTSR